MKVKKGDTVKVLCGKDRGKQGDIIRVLPKTSRVLVQGVNIVTKHIKKRTQQDTKPTGRVKMEAPIHVSNVQVINPTTGNSARIAFKIVEGKKERIFKDRKEVRSVKKETLKKSSEKPVVKETKKSVTKK